MRVEVGPVASFRDGERRIVHAGRRSIGVFRVGERFFALRNRCPHQGAPLCEGPLVPRMASDGPGDVRVDAGRPMISCPWHGWEYELETGRSFVSVDPGVRRYPVTVETFPVRVDEGDVVVVDV